jgi:peptidoglycan/xylan/chitin deacetylase (PgdA/CDA1 family)
MQFLANHFNVLPLREAAQRLRNGTLPARAACVTFDDGYADNYTVALPILKQTGVPATFFIATAYLDGGRMFNDTLIELAKAVPVGVCDLSSVGLGTQTIDTVADRRALMAKLIGHFKYQPPEHRLPAAERLAADFGIRLPDDLMMRTDQLRALHAAGMDIGGHTHSHPILARQTSEAAREEVKHGKERLESLLGEPIRVFAYPNGRPLKDYGPEHVSMAAECGFEAAVSTRPAAADQRSGPHELPRFTPWDKTPARFGLRLLRMLCSTG